jgi:hypothetical protein
MLKNCVTLYVDVPLETLKNVLLCPLFYAICPPFQEAPSGNPTLCSCMVLWEANIMV